MHVELHVGVPVLGSSGVRTYPAIILEGEASLKSSFWRTIKEFAGARLLSSRKTGSAPRYAFIISYEKLRFAAISFDRW